MEVKLNKKQAEFQSHYFPNMIGDSDNLGYKEAQQVLATHTTALPSPWVEEQEPLSSMSFHGVLCLFTRCTNAILGQLCLEGPSISKY